MANRLDTDPFCHTLGFEPERECGAVDALPNAAAEKLAVRLLATSKSTNGQTWMPSAGIVFHDSARWWRVDPETGWHACDNQQSREDPVAALEGKVAIVTGASSGIGRATAKLFAREGARLVVAGRRQPGLDALVAEIAEAGGEAVAMLGDVKDEAHARDLVDRAGPPMRRARRA